MPTRYKFRASARGAGHKHKVASGTTRASAGILGDGFEVLTNAQNLNGKEHATVTLTNGRRYGGPDVNYALCHVFSDDGARPVLHPTVSFFKRLDEEAMLALLRSNDETRSWWAKMLFMAGGASP